MPSFIALLLLSALGFASEPQKFALVLGGGGDPPGPTTIFDQSTMRLSARLKQANYETDLAFDGGHEASQKQVSDLYGHPVEPFTKEIALNKINQMASRIDTMKAGDQVMVIINTHGSPAEDEHSSHKVWTNTDESQTVDVGELSKIQAAAEKRGVKLAIIDASCFSGATLDLAKGSNTCVITAASKTVYGYNNFPGQLAEQMHPGQSLEESFLAQRKINPYGFPMISSEAGLSAQAILDAITSNSNGNMKQTLGFAVGADGKPIFPKTLEREVCAVHNNLEKKVPEVIEILNRSYGIDPESVNRLRSALRT